MENLFKGKGVYAMRGQVCRMCGTDYKKVLFEKRGIPYYRCRECGFIFSYPGENANFANKFDDYEASYLNYLIGTECDRKNYALLLTWMSKFCSWEGKRVLDVGAGSGKFVRFLREKKIEAFGLEPARALYERFLSKDSYFFCCYLEDFKEHLIGGNVDILVSWDVIEHMERPTVFFQNAAKLLKTGGMLFLDTPDVGSVLPRILGKWWHHYNRYHLSYFSRNTLATLAAQNGLKEIGFARLSYLKSMKYILQYLNEFVIGSKRMEFLKHVTETAIPINMRDMMFVAFQKN